MIRRLPAALGRGHGVFVNLFRGGQGEYSEHWPFRRLGCNPASVASCWIRRIDIGRGVQEGGLRPSGSQNRSALLSWLVVPPGLMLMAQSEGGAGRGTAAALDDPEAAAFGPPDHLRPGRTQAAGEVYVILSGRALDSFLLPKIG